MNETDYEKLEKSAPKDWQEVKLGEVVMFKRGYDLSKAEMQDGNIPVAGSNGIITKLQPMLLE